MVLLVWGALHSLRARPRRAPGVLCAAIAWSGANIWSAATTEAYDNGEGLINASPARFHRHGVGFHDKPSGSLLKSDDVMNASLR